MLGNLSTKIYLKWIERKGFQHGKNFDIEKGANIDSGFCKFISCGDNVTITKDVYILAHDASMKKKLGKTKVGKVIIGNDVFIGAKTVVLSGVHIGDNVIIGANSTVTKSIPSGEVWGGSPARFIMMTEDFLEKHRLNMQNNISSKEDGLKILENEKFMYVE